MRNRVDCIRHEMTARETDDRVFQVFFEPGDGYRYRLIVSFLVYQGTSALSFPGDVLLSFELVHGNGYWSIPWTFGQLFHLDYAGDKLQASRMDDRSVRVYVCMVNWVMSSIGDDLDVYAREVWDSLGLSDVD